MGMVINLFLDAIFISLHTWMAADINGGLEIWVSTYNLTSYERLIYIFKLIAIFFIILLSAGFAHKTDANDVEISVMTYL